jgi:hypothetical protein
LCHSLGRILALERAERIIHHQNFEKWLRPQFVRAFVANLLFISGDFPCLYLGNSQQSPIRFRSARGFVPQRLSVHLASNSASGRGEGAADKIRLVSCFVQLCLMFPEINEFSSMKSRLCLALSDVVDTFWDASRFCLAGIAMQP